MHPGQDTDKQQPVNPSIRGTTSGCLSACLPLPQINKGKKNVREVIMVPIKESKSFWFSKA